MNLNKLKSSELDAAMFGMILGDGSIDKGGGNFTSGSNYIFKMGHAEKQREYLLWKKQIIDQISHTNCIVYDYMPTKSVYLRTKALKYFTKLEKIFYVNRKKLINKKILSKLNELSLVIWFLDDGYMSLNNSGSVYGELCTDQFTLAQQQLIKNWFKTKFKIDVGIRDLKYKTGKYAGKISHRITFNKEACINISKIVKPYVKNLNSMQYKLKV